jgi:hypothetical protein
VPKAVWLGVEAERPTPVESGLGAASELGTTRLPASWWRRLQRPAQRPEEKEWRHSPGVEDGATCSGWWRGRGGGGDPMGLVLSFVRGSGRWSNGSTSARGGGWGLTRRREREAEEPSARRGGAFPAEDTTWQRALLGSIGVLCSGTAMAVVAAMPSPACSAAWRALHLRCAITPPRVSFTCCSQMLILTVATNLKVPCSVALPCSRFCSRSSQWLRTGTIMK